MRQNQVIHYDYQPGFDDKFLDLLKKIYPSPEARHHFLPRLARILSWYYRTRHKLHQIDLTLKFHDKSMPLSMASPVILAAGGNKSGVGLSSFHALGFGGVTVGSATRKAHEGNTFRPRLSMINEDRGLNNSMGLNNPGIDVIANEVDLNLGLCHREKMAVGISIADTPGLTTHEEKIGDILYSFRKAYSAADYIEVNVRCPNTGKNRIDWQSEFLETLLKEIMRIRKSMAPRKAVFVKLSPDLSQKFLDEILQIISDCGVTGLVLFNTFPGERAKFLQMKTADSEIAAVTSEGMKGGISGRALYQNTLPAVRFIKKRIPHLSILAVGGIDHGAKVLDLLEAGADAVQCYTVLAYRWNAIHKINRELVSALHAKGAESLEYFIHS